MRVMFVDDEPGVLDGLRRMLRAQRTEWDMQFVTTGAEALMEMERSGAVDVVVTDMRMPGMDGAALLEQLRARHPLIVRILLSGQTDLAGAPRSIPAADRLLTKPCDPTDLKEAIAWAGRESTVEQRRGCDRDDGAHE